MSPPPKDMRELFANLPASLREKNPQLDALSARAIEAAPPSERAAVETALARRALDTRRGRTAAAVGDRFEDWLTGWHELLVARDRLAWMEHFGPATRMVRGEDGKVAPRIVGVAPPDFLGQIAGGRVIAVEAKSRSARLYRDDPPGPRRGIAKHQQRFLARVAEFGGVALLAVEFRREGLAPLRCVIPWTRVPWQDVAGGGPSIGPADPDVLAWAVAPAALLDPRDARAVSYLEAFLSPAPSIPSTPAPEAPLP